MAQFPALPLFCDSWTLDTRHLTRSERGTYLDLLMLMWITPGCRVPNERRWIEDRLGYPRDDPELARIIKEFCKSDGNWLTQKRLRKEFFYLESKSRTASDRSKRRWGNGKISSRSAKQPPTDQRKRRKSHNKNSCNPTPPNESIPLPPLEKGAEGNGHFQKRRRRTPHDSIAEGIAISRERGRREREKGGG